MTQSSGDLSVYTKSIRLSEKIGLPRVWKADSDAEICVIFYKNGTNCSTKFHMGESVTDEHKAGGAALGLSCGACFRGSHP